jgi:hypothetical protein
VVKRELPKLESPVRSRVPAPVQGMTRLLHQAIKTHPVGLQVIEIEVVFHDEFLSTGVLMINLHDPTPGFDLGDNCGVMLEALRIIAPTGGLFTLHIDTAELNNVPRLNIFPIARFL